MPAIFDYRHLVREDEIDDQGHVNNLRHLAWMQSAAIAHSSAQGWTPERYRETGAGWVVRTHFIEYRQSAFAADEIVVRTWVTGFQKVTSVRKYLIVRPRDGALIAIAETNWAYVGFQTRLPRRIPRELIAAFDVVPPEREPPSGEPRDDRARESLAE